MDRRALKRLTTGLGARALVAPDLTTPAGVAAHTGWHVAEWGVVGWTGVHLRGGRDGRAPYCMPDNPGAYDPTTLVCRLTREPLGVAHPHLDWPRCLRRRL